MLGCCHFGISVDCIQSARDFYVNKLGLKMIDDKVDALHLFAVQADSVRISVIESAAPRLLPLGAIILRTTDLDKTINALRSEGVSIDSAINEAPGFMRYATLHDPSGNPLHIAEYLRDPTQ